MTPPVVAVVGGSDSGAGAGIQADLKTLTAHGVFGTTVVTSVTAQNTVEIDAVHVIPTDVVTAQFEAVERDYTVTVVKTGYLANAEIVEAMAAHLGDRPSVIDPVVVASDGRPIVDQVTVDGYRRLFDAATVVTPNYREAAGFTGVRVDDINGMERAALTLAERHGTAVLVTGGHLPTPDAVDILAFNGVATRLVSPRIATRNVHGTGCSLASSIAARLAMGDDVTDAIDRARAWVHSAIAAASSWTLGSGQGAIDHHWQARGRTD